MHNGYGLGAMLMIFPLPEYLLCGVGEYTDITMSALELVQSAQNDQQYRVPPLPGDNLVAEVCCLPQNGLRM